MELDDIKPIIEKYMNIEFLLYQDDRSLVIKFNGKNLEVEWYWDDKERITNVKIDTLYNCLTSEKEEDYKFAIDLIKTTSEIELGSKEFEDMIKEEYKKIVNDVLKSI